MAGLENKSEALAGKKDSFYGDRSIVMSRKLLKEIWSNELISGLFITDMGYYPHAVNHYRKRGKGISEHILIYCVHGNGMIRMQGQTFVLESGSSFVIPAGEPHVYHASEDQPWSIYWIHFGGARSHVFSRFFGKIIPLKACTTSRIDERINLFNEILTALEMGFTRENIEFANLSLGRLLASFFYLDTFRASKGHQSNNPVDQAIFFMQGNLNRCLRIHDIAQQVHLSESHLSRIFKHKTGSSPIDYFINLKMQEAIRLLSNQSMRIKEVAFSLGYDDPFYFSRQFKKHIGVSPGAFVKGT